MATAQQRRPGRGAASAQSGHVVPQAAEGDARDAVPVAVGAGGTERSGQLSHAPRASTSGAGRGDGGGGGFGGGHHSSSFRLSPERLFDLSSSSFNLVPANVKVKKRVRLGVLPLELTGSLVWNLDSHRVRYKLALRDAILHGKLVANVEERALEYRKRLRLPSIPGSLIVGARWQYDAASRSVKPSYNLGWELGRGAEVTHLNSLRFKPRLFYKHIGVEALTEVSVQLPKQLVFDTRGADAARADGAADGDAWGVNLDVQELNLVLRL